jgi:hypothetical protein
VRQQQQQWLAGGEDHSSSCQDLLQQLGYREYGRYLSFHFPFFHEHALLSHLHGVPWRLDNRAFKVRHRLLRIAVACIGLALMGYSPFACGKVIYVMALCFQKGC